MKGVVFLGDGKVEVREFRKPEPGSGEVVVKMMVAGLCGSDLHFMHETAAERAGSVIIVGHEPCGVVDTVGEGVTGVREGDKVSVYHYRGCGRCRHCLAGNYFWCPEKRGYGGPIDGSSADFILTDARNCLLLPPELNFVDGALIACCAGTAWSSMRKLQVSGQHTLAVFGQGPVGLSGLLIAKGMGAHVISVEPNPERRALAKRLGADFVIDPAAGDPVESIRRLTGGRGADMAFETSGSPAGQYSTVECLCNGGRAVIVGFGSKEKSVNLSQINVRQLTLMGSFVMNIGMYGELTDFLVSRKISLESMVTHRFPIEKAVEAFALFDRGNTGKVVLQWS